MLVKLFPAIGLLAGRFTAAEKLGQTLTPPPGTTAFGALLGHITGGHIVSDDEPGKRSFQPMNVNFGLFPPIPGKSKMADRKKMYTGRAKDALAGWMAG